MTVDPNSIDLPAFVADGASVTNGQQIGEVGDLGNARGRHLHFEVHPNGGTIFQDPGPPPFAPNPFVQTFVGANVQAGGAR